MGDTVAQKILKSHLVDGNYEVGKEIAIRIDNTLTQDATGTMAYLQFEALGIPKVKTELSVSFIDHNTLQSGFRNADDHRYLQSIAQKYGIKLSKPGNGICHQLFLERFAKPGKTLLGSDSHTPTAGGVGQLAIGAGGLDVAVAMGGGAFYLTTPKIVGVKLTGQLQPMVSAKDVILEVLRRIDVKGGVGNILEYCGPGVETLSVPERACITNMGTETGCTTSIFPSDNVTKEFFEAQGRGDQWSELKPDPDAQYDEIIEIDLAQVVPLAAAPHSPGNVVPISELEGQKVDQVCVGSCTNSSYKDLMAVAAILKGKKVHKDISFMVSPGSKQVLSMISDNGALSDILGAGARMLENACGPCIGMGGSPRSAGVSVRTFNRNFKGRSGTADANVYLVSPEVAAATALAGSFADPRKLDVKVEFKMPEHFKIDDGLILEPSADGSSVEIQRGPNIKKLPEFKAMPDTITAKALLKVEDNITTDHIMPAGAKILPLRSNIPAISEYVFEQVDPTFASRAKESGSGSVIGGENYGQGSSREHAALAPYYLGIKFVLVKSFARIHKANLVNFGILPLELENAADYDKIDQGDELEISGLHEALKQDDTRLVVKNKTKGMDMPAKLDVGPRFKEILLAGGKLNHTKMTAGGN